MKIVSENHSLRTIATKKTMMGKVRTLKFRFRNIFENPPAPLQRGTKAVDLESVGFLTLSSHCHSASSLCFYVFRGPKKPRICPHQTQNMRFGISSKIVSSSSLFSSLKKSEKRFPRHQQNTTKRSRNSLKTISTKNRFLQ